jgi:hypothetical protein
VSKPKLANPQKFDYYDFYAFLPGSEDDRAKLATTLCRAREMGDEERKKKLERSTKKLDMFSCPRVCSEICKQTCEATLMNGLRCSSKARYGKYCGRHKLV